jgi:hypothetical protein
MPRTRDPNSKVGKVRTALIKLLNEHRTSEMLPTSARFLFYELVARSIVAKMATTKAKPEQIVIDALTILRELGVTRGGIPWNWIVDETRQLHDYTGFRSIKEGLLAYLEVIELDPWVGDYPLVLTESRSLAGVLKALLREYRAKVSATNGQVGGYLHTVIGPALKTQYEESDGLVPRVGYLGDLDKAGGDIEGNTKRVLEKIVGTELYWVRLALTQEQVNLYRLPVISKFDKRDKKFHDSVETEALSQSVIVQIVKDWLEEILPNPLKDTVEEEERQREAWREAIEDHEEQ